MSCRSLHVCNVNQMKQFDYNAGINGATQKRMRGILMTEFSVYVVGRFL